jgi:hypothetical protein
LERGVDLLRLAEGVGDRVTLEQDFHNSWNEY